MGLPGQEKSLTISSAVWNLKKLQQNLEIQQTEKKVTKLITDITI